MQSLSGSASAVPEIPNEPCFIVFSINLQVQMLIVLIGSFVRPLFSKFKNTPSLPWVYNFAASALGGLLICKKFGEFETEAAVRLIYFETGLVCLVWNFLVHHIYNLAVEQ